MKKLPLESEWEFCIVCALECKVVVFVLVENLLEALDISCDVAAKDSGTGYDDIGTGSYDVRRVGQLCAAVDF